MADAGRVRAKRVRARGVWARGVRRAYEDHNPPVHPFLAHATHTRAGAHALLVAFKAVPVACVLANQRCIAFRVGCARNRRGCLLGEPHLDGLVALPRRQSREQSSCQCDAKRPGSGRHGAAGQPLRETIKSSFVQIDTIFYSVVDVQVSIAILQYCNFAKARVLCVRG